MLTYAQSIPDQPQAGAPVLLLLHGRGSDERDLLGLRPGLPPEAIVISPRAPFAGAVWGYGAGFAWYRYLGGTTPEASSFERSVLELRELVEALPGLLPVVPGPVIAGGFSQGGTTALGFALLNRARIAGVMIFSGFLPSLPAVQASLANAAGLPVFWWHGTADPMIPFASGLAGREALRDAGACVTTGDYPIGHWIDPTELANAAAWLASVPGTREARA